MIENYMFDIVNEYINNEIVIIDYDNPMGYTIESFGKKEWI